MIAAKEIRNKILSIKNLQKITKAMEMIAIAKMHKSKNRMMISSPYMNNILKVVNNIIHSNLEYKPPYIIERTTKCVGYLLISTDHGLCGSLNTNLFRKLISNMQVWYNKSIRIILLIIGSKGVSFFKSHNNKIYNILDYITNLGEDIDILKLNDFINIFLNLYKECSLDKLYVASNKFVNITSQIPTINQLLPIPRSENEKLNLKFCNYIYEPDPKITIDILLSRYIHSQIYQLITENLVSEHAARMIMMKSANDNSYKIVEELKLMYNKIRQSIITKELNEIISGMNVI